MEEDFEKEEETVEDVLGFDDEETPEEGELEEEEEAAPGFDDSDEDLDLDEV